MDVRNAAIAYRQASIENAPPIKIVRLLYEGAIRFIDRGDALMKDGLKPGWTQWLTRADAIVNELRCCLDLEVAPEVGGELDRLYVFVQSRMSKAVVEKDTRPLADARRILATLLEGWMQVEIETIGRVGA